MEERKSKPANPVRRWCFTINNYNDDDIKLCQEIDYKYIIMGNEKGEQGTPHIQGYVVLNKPCRFKALHERLPRAHLEAAKGTHEECVEYCKKEGDFCEFGALRQGERTDLDEARMMCQEDRPMREVTTVCSSPAIRVAEKYLSYNETPRDQAPDITWIWGPSGCGKSRWAREQAELQAAGDVYYKNDTTRWWDGYDGHRCAVIDDWRSDSWPVTYTLGLLDRYPFRVETKGGYRQFKANHIWITTINTPEQEWIRFHASEDSRQLLRRITRIVSGATLSFAPAPVQVQRESLDSV